MALVELTLALPASLAEDARAQGLLAPDALERLLREELRRRQVDRLFQAADRLAGLGPPPLTDSEIDAEIQAARAERRSGDALRN